MAVGEPIFRKTWVASFAADHSRGPPILSALGVALFSGGFDLGVFGVLSECSVTLTILKPRARAFWAFLLQIAPPYI